VDDDGAVQFRDDIYGHDARQERILPARPIPGSMQVAQQGAAGSLRRARFRPADRGRARTR
jgi:hypothetical protein